MIHLLTGPIDSGKTSLLERAVAAWRSRGLKVRGFLSRKVDGGYDLFDLAEQASHDYLRKTGDEAWQRTGPYFVLPTGLERASALLEGDADLFVVDEIGPLEMRGLGIMPALEGLLRRPPSRCVLVVQERILQEFLGLAARDDITVHDVRKEDAYSRMLNGIQAT
jgi:nucleoside-triphosphatase THEP1